MAGKVLGVTVAWVYDCSMVNVGWEGFGWSLLPRYMIALWLLLAGKGSGSLLPWYVIALWLLLAGKGWGSLLPGYVVALW